MTAGLSDQKHVLRAKAGHTKEETVNTCHYKKIDKNFTHLQTANHTHLEATTGEAADRRKGM